MLVLLVWAAGCGMHPDEAPSADEELLSTLGLGGGAQLHRITLGGRGAEEHAVPARIQASPGDAVEFLTVDHRVHTVVFPADSLRAEILTFLDETGQRASPPLVSLGSRFFLRLQEAPTGRYPFVSEGHGGTAWGIVEVGISQDSLAANPS